MVSNDLHLNSELTSKHCKDSDSNQKYTVDNVLCVCCCAPRRTGVSLQCERVCLWTIFARATKIRSSAAKPNYFFRAPLDLRVSLRLCIESWEQYTDVQVLIHTNTHQQTHTRRCIVLLLLLSHFAYTMRSTSAKWCTHARTLTFGHIH